MKLTRDQLKRLIAVMEVMDTVGTDGGPQNLMGRHGRAMEEATRVGVPQITMAEAPLVLALREMRERERGSVDLRLTQPEVMRVMLAFAREKLLERDVPFEAD